MRGGRYLTTIALFAALVTALAAGYASASAPEPRPNPASAHIPRTVPGQVVVRFGAHTSAARRAAVRRSVGARRLQALPVPGVELLRVARGSSVRATVKRLEGARGVRVAEPNFVLSPTAVPCPGTVSGGRCVPNDPRFRDLWRLDNAGQAVGGKTGKADADIDAPEAWVKEQGSPDVTIAVVDTGVAYDHPDLAPNIWQNPGETGTDAQGADRRSNGIDDDANGYTDDWRGWDLADDDNDPRDLRGHGSHVAGIAAGAGNNGVGITGVAWKSKIMPVRALGYKYGTTSASVAEGFEYAADNGARVVNLSDDLPDYSSILKGVIDAHPNVIFAVAAGNNPAVDIDQPGDDEYPCEYTSPNIICVAATDSSDAKASFSKWGPVSVDLGAPGHYAYSTVPARKQVWSESFEGASTGLPPGWSTGADGSVASRWGVSTQSPKQGSRSISDSPTGTASPGSNTWIQNTNPINLSGQQGCQLLYTLTLSSLDSDVFYAQGRRDTAFSPYAPGDADELGTASGALSLAGRQDDLINLDGTANAYLRFGLRTSAATTARDGAFLDFARILCLTGTYSAGGATEVELMAGTSMATPMVAGTAALVLSRHPELTAAQVKDSILRGTDKIASMQGKTVSNGRLNANGALAISDTLTSEPPPAENRAPTAKADATPKSGAAPLAVAFTSAGSSDPDSDALTYEWDFGDGSATSSAAAPSHTYAAGSYTARLIVRDGRGGSDTATVPIEATTPPPTGSDTLLEAEAFPGVKAGGTVRPVAATGASGGQEALFVGAATVTNTVTTPAVSRITVRARGVLCSGSPAMDVSVDGTKVITTAVANTDYADFSAPLTLAPGQHTVFTGFTNPVNTGPCRRYLRVDKVTLGG